ncbi:hypothetical protein C5B96_09145 [Subtercola sp. Z020]|uniref:DUF3488 domain-containing protein n=1 Tax=Subtercola sp. Z020 TaxID=2080582 RepID=UPI000CE7C2C8|nr:DUF3488 domain-containing protein [Subtercola sp. Z020]PPF82454.1 hypothetical protein C5B96_09145 [Subtercola sp. Z020]
MSIHLPALPRGIVSSRPALRRGAAALAVLAAVGLHIWLQWSYLFAQADFAWSSFRNYFPGDQLSYMSMVTNAADGRLADVEPFTNTGTNTYPHLYYNVIGTVARLVGLNPLQAWSIGGFLVQAVLIAAIATAIYLVSRRWWLPVLAPVPFVLGTFANAISAGGWYTNMASHAVLWGPFGVFYTLNGETVALSLGASGILVALVTFLRVRRRGASVAFYALAAALVGLTANVQTYGFLASAYLALFAVAAFVLCSRLLLPRRRAVLVAVSLALIVLVFAVGPTIASTLGPLATLAFGAVPALPALVVLVLRFRLGALLPLLALAATASPQIIATMLGIVSKDPFLSYRVASSVDLGVDGRGILGAGAVLLPLLGILLAGIHRRNALWVSFPLAAIAAWALTSTNDIWGANQEPYRFWLDTFCLVSFVTVPVATMVAVSYLARRRRAVATATGPATAATAPAGPARRSVVSVVAALVVVAVCVVAAGVSAIDFHTFRNLAGLHTFIDYNTPRYQAIGQLGLEVPKTGAGLINPDACIDVEGLKIVSDGAPVATFNEGMAWPTDYAEVRAVNHDRKNGFQIASDAAAADVKWVITDSSCTPFDWGTYYADELSFVDSRSYPTATGDATVTLWAFTP